MDELFRQLGLGDKETQTFLKLVELGAQPVSIVAKHVGLPRSSMYFTLDKLKEVGVIEEFERSGIKYVRAIAVEILPEVLRQKEEKLRQALKNFEEHLPRLRAMESRLSITPAVRFIEGRDAVKRMYLNEQTQWTKEWYSVYNTATVNDIVPQLYEPNVYSGKDGSATELVVDNPEGRKMAESFRGDPRMRIKFLPKGVTFDSDIAVAEDSIYLSAMRDGDASAVVIVHPQLAEEMRSIFRLLWESLPEQR